MTTKDLSLTAKYRLPYLKGKQRSDGLHEKSVHFTNEKNGTFLSRGIAKLRRFIPRKMSDAGTILSLPIQIALDLFQRQNDAILRLSEAANGSFSNAVQQFFNPTSHFNAVTHLENNGFAIGSAFVTAAAIADVRRETEHFDNNRFSQLVDGTAQGPLRPAMKEAFDAFHGSAKTRENVNEFKLAADIARGVHICPVTEEVLLSEDKANELSLRFGHAQTGLTASIQVKSFAPNEDFVGQTVTRLAPRDVVATNEPAPVYS